MELAKSIIAPLLGPLGTAALVLLLVIFMLLQREDLRSRLIRLIGQGRISAHDAGDGRRGQARLALPAHAVRRECHLRHPCGDRPLFHRRAECAALGRVRDRCSASSPTSGRGSRRSFPIVLSLAVSPNWTMPLLTIGAFRCPGTAQQQRHGAVALWIEHRRFVHRADRRRGLLDVALGAGGLVLATPLTVCLVVMGRHVPRLAFLSILLSDEEALTPAEDCYHRLLTVGRAGRDGARGEVSSRATRSPRSTTSCSSR